ncbi:MAG: hypothetical protein RL076_392 [Chloroflexota bacterium]|jgi:hypothetical protein
MQTQWYSRQFMLVFVVLYSVAFPWACSRHCAVHVASRSTPMHYVCAMTPTMTSATSPEATPNTLIHAAKPAIVLFVLVSVLRERYTMQIQPYTLSNVQWQTLHIATPVPPPKYTFR